MALSQAGSLSRYLYTLPLFKSGYVAALKLGTADDRGIEGGGGYTKQFDGRAIAQIDLGAAMHTMQALETDNGNAGDAILNLRAANVRLERCGVDSIERDAGVVRKKNN